MALGEPIKFRLSPDQHAKYEHEAEQLGKPLGTYLRERLEADDTTRDELAAIRHELGNLHDAVEDLAAAGPREQATSGQGPTAMQIEILLMLRAIGGPDRTKTVRAELKRLGYDIWTQDERGK